MTENKEVCQYCAYAALRADTDKKRFNWCDYVCTLPADDPGRHIAYKYKNDTCKHFMPTDRPSEN